MFCATKANDLYTQSVLVEAISNMFAIVPLLLALCSYIIPLLHGHLENISGSLLKVNVCIEEGKKSSNCKRTAVSGKTAVS